MPIRIPKPFIQDGFERGDKEAVPLHRAAKPEEMAGMVLFLCSDAASYITGQTGVVDGGQMTRGLVPVEEAVYATRA